MPWGSSVTVFCWWIWFLIWYCSVDSCFILICTLYAREENESNGKPPVRMMMIDMNIENKEMTIKDRHTMCVLSKWNLRIFLLCPGDLSRSCLWSLSRSISLFLSFFSSTWYNRCSSLRYNQQPILFLDTWTFQWPDTHLLAWIHLSYYCEHPILEVGSNWTIASVWFLSICYQITKDDWVPARNQIA